jgi:hypothetical protein
MFTLGEVECAGACVNAPLFSVNDDYYVCCCLLLSCFMCCCPSRLGALFPSTDLCLLISAPLLSKGNSQPLLAAVISRVRAVFLADEAVFSH